MILDTKALACFISAFADINGNNRPDLFISGAHGMRWKTTRLYRNDGPVATAQPLEAASNLDFRPFPNPNYTDRLHISYSGVEGQTLSLQLYTSTGQLLLEKQVAAPGSQSVYSFNIGNLEAGFYLLKLSDGQASRTRKLILR